MKRIIVLVILFVMLPVSSYGDKFYKTGHELVVMAQEYDKYANGNKYNYFTVGQYMGFIMGVYEVTEWMYKEPPGETTARQMCAIVSNSLKAHPKEWFLKASDLIQMAFVDAFGVNDKTQHIYKYMIEERNKLYNKP